MPIAELSPLLQQLLAEYQIQKSEIETGKRQPFDLSMMQIANWAENFQRNPDAAAVETEVEAWAKTYGIWLNGYSEHTITMGAYLHPETKDRRTLAVMIKTYLILFYIDDTISNDLQKNLTPEEKERGKKMMSELNMLIKGTAHHDHESEFGLTNATRDVFNDLQEMADPEWLEEFVFSLQEHLDDTVEDQNRAAEKQNGSLDVEEFLEIRNHISGMFVTTAFMTFATGEYLPLPLLPVDIQTDCQNLEYLCAVIGGIANEFYSFEKEVIKNTDEFNIIPVMMAQNASGFQEAILAAMAYMNQTCTKFIEVSERLAGKLSTRPLDLKPSYYQALETYLRQAKFVALASWFWQLDTDRYQSELSIFLQTNQQWRKSHHLQGRLRSGQLLPEEIAGRGSISNSL